jgi:hypothetical protein
LGKLAWFRLQFTTKLRMGRCRQLARTGETSWAESPPCQGGTGGAANWGGFVPAFQAGRLSRCVPPTRSRLGCHMTGFQPGCRRGATDEVCFITKLNLTNNCPKGLFIEVFRLNRETVANKYGYENILF